MDNRIERPADLDKGLQQQIEDLPSELDENLSRLNEPFRNDPRPSNADNTANDPQGGIHSGDALPDPIGRTLSGETDSESLEYYPDDVIDQDPILGSPQGLRNQDIQTSELENVADMDENVLDRIDEQE